MKFSSVALALFTAIPLIVATSSGPIDSLEIRAAEPAAPEPIPDLQALDKRKGGSSSSSGSSGSSSSDDSSNSGSSSGSSSSDDSSGSGGNSSSSSSGNSSSGGSSNYAQVSAASENTLVMGSVVGSMVIPALLGVVGTVVVLGEIGF